MPYDDHDDDVDDLDIRQSRQEVPTYLTPAILVTLCCCVPFGIVVIVNASQVSTHLARGEYDQAVQASDRAKQWCWLGAIFGGIASVIAVVLQIALEAGKF